LGVAKGGLPSPRLGLHQAATGGSEQKEETEVAGDAKKRLDDAMEDAEVEMGDAVIESSARRVSRASRLDDLHGTTVEADPDEAEEHMDEPRGGSWCGLGERREDRGTSDNSPTKPGPLACGGKSKGGLKPSMVPGANEYSEPVK